MAMIVPNAESTDGAQFGIEGGKTLFGPGDVLDVDADDGVYLVTDGTVYRAVSKIVDGNGKSSGSVSPSSHSFDTSDPTPEQMRVGLKLTVPSTPGDYMLSVEFELTSGGEKVTRTYPIKVVEPIVLRITVKNTSVNNVASGLDFQFIIDGQAQEVTNKNVSINANSTTTIEYKWIVDSPSEGRHTYSVTVSGDNADGRMNIEGLDHEFTFYVGQDNYGWLTTIMVVLLIILLLVVIWVIRKPIKNFGKPKGRR